MITRICYQTLDGQIHLSKDKAEIHADKAYGAELSRLAHQLVKIEKYKDMLEFLDKADFGMLLALRKDLEVIPLDDTN